MFCVIMKVIAKRDVRRLQRGYDDDVDRVDKDAGRTKGW